MNARLGFVTIVMLVLCTPLSTAQDGPDLCHTMGRIASEAARARNKGVPVTDVIATYRKIAATSTLPEPERSNFQFVAKQFERIALAVYKTKITPDDAYIQFREACESAAP